MAFLSELLLCILTLVSMFLALYSDRIDVPRPIFHAESESDIYFSLDPFFGCKKVL